MQAYYGDLAETSKSERHLAQQEWASAYREWKAKRQAALDYADALDNIARLHNELAQSDVKLGSKERRRQLLDTAEKLATIVHEMDAAFGSTDENTTGGTDHGHTR